MIVVVAAAVVFVIYDNDYNDRDETIIVVAFGVVTAAAAAAAAAAVVLQRSTPVTCSYRPKVPQDGQAHAMTTLTIWNSTGSTPPLPPTHFEVPQLTVEFFRRVT